MDFSEVSGLPGPFSLQAALVALNALEHCHSKWQGQIADATVQIHQAWVSSG